MHVRQCTRIVFMMCLLTTLLVVSQQSVTSDISLQYQQDIPLDRVSKNSFLPSDGLVDNYVDAVVGSPALGGHTNPPPNGMGNDTIGSTTITESSYESPIWRTIQNEDFSTAPSGWFIDGIGISTSGGYFYDNALAGTMEGAAVNTQDSLEVRFILNIDGDWPGQFVTVWFLNSTSDWIDMGDLSDASAGDQTISSTSGQFQFNEFKVKITYGLFMLDEEFQGDDWRIQKRETYDYYAFQAVYQFNDVVHDVYSIEDLVIDFSDSTSSTENLQFRFESDDSSPDNILTIPDTSGDVDIVVDISQYLTGSTCYLDIRDTTRSESDIQQSEWIIDKVYIRLNEVDSVWDDIPTDQIIEFVDPFSYQMNATLAPSLDTWWVNDTVNFAIDGSGFIQNATILPVGDYGLSVFVNDTIGRTLNEEFTVSVQDTVDPEWTSPITNQEEEFGVDFEYILGATDAAGINSWNLNDSVDFHMDNGIITNNTPLDVGYYGLNVTVTDNNDNSLSDVFRVFINDTADPEWVSAPVNQFREFGLVFIYDLDATDLAGISWHINGTDFNIDSDGVIRNVTALTVQTYGLLVTAEDGHGNTISESFSLLVNDTTNPVWVQDPTNQFREFGAPFSYNLNASDLAGITSWLIDDMENFTIGLDGIVSNITIIEVGNYSLHVTAFDNHGNPVDGYFILEVEDTTPPNWDVIPPIQELELGESFNLQLHVSDLSNISAWWGNNSAFSISDGLIQNATFLTTGEYGLQVFVNDTWGRTSNINITITVEDTGSPFWTTTITNQSEEYGVRFEYTIGADDLGGIKSWSLNDSIHFLMDNGVIRNNTILQVGIYWLNVTVTDYDDNLLSDIFSVFINDTINPIWKSIPVDQGREFGLDFVYDLNATDVAGITWHINDTSFDIDADGVIRNIAGLTVQTYGLLITVEDAHGNAISASFALLISDTTNPVWIQNPTMQSLEYGGQFSYDLDAFDLAGISTWLIDDMENFTIDGDGIVSNITFLEVGNYSLHVTAIDDHGLSLDGYFILEVEDTTLPNWDVVPSVQDLEFGEQLSLQLDASDLSGIVLWQINNTVNFTISSTGFLTSLDNLDSGWYFVEVTATDGHGLTSSIVVSVFVALSPSTTSTTTTTTPDIGLMLVLGIGGIAIGTVVLFATLRIWRSVQKDRLQQLEGSKGEVDTALDYLESIKPTLEGEDEDT